MLYLSLRLFLDEEFHNLSTCDLWLSLGCQQASPATMSAMSDSITPIEVADSDDDPSDAEIIGALEHGQADSDMWRRPGPSPQIRVI